MFNVAENLMNDINAIAVQLQDNTKKQEVTLIQTDQQMATVVVNTNEAHKEITEAQEHQKSTAKWLVWLILIVLAIVTIVVLVILLKK